MQTEGVQGLGGFKGFQNKEAPHSKLWEAKKTKKKGLNRPEFLADNQRGMRFTVGQGQIQTEGVGLLCSTPHLL